MTPKPNFLPTTQPTPTFPTNPGAKSVSPVSTTERTSVGDGLKGRDLPASKTFVAQLRPSSAAKDYSYFSSGAIAEGHYTEF